METDDDQCSTCVQLVAFYEWYVDTPYMCEQVSCLFALCSMGCVGCPDVSEVSWPVFTVVQHKLALDLGLFADNESPQEVGESARNTFDDPQTTNIFIGSVEFCSDFKASFVSNILYRNNCNNYIHVYGSNQVLLYGI